MDMLNRPPIVSVVKDESASLAPGVRKNCISGMRKTWEPEGRDEMCKQVTNRPTGLAVNYHAYILYLLPIFFLVRQVHQRIMLPVCG